MIYDVCNAEFSSAYRACEDRLEQEDDLRALTARHSLIIELIEVFSYFQINYNKNIHSTFFKFIFILN